MRITKQGHEQLRARSEISLPSTGGVKESSLLKSASHALRSYQYGNASPDLAKMIADKIDEQLSARPAYEDLRIALDESVKLQAHYAKLLNMHDGGERMVFPTADLWLARLKETGTLPGK